MWELIYFSSQRIEKWNVSAFDRISQVTFIFLQQRIANIANENDSCKGDNMCLLCGKECVWELLNLFGSFYNCLSIQRICKAASSDIACKLCCKLFVMILFFKDFYLFGSSVYVCLSEIPLWLFDFLYPFNIKIFVATLL